MADKSKLSITAAVVSAGKTEKITSTISEVNPSLTDAQLGEFADSIGTLLRYEPDYYTRTDTSILAPGGVDEQKFMSRKEIALHGNDAEA